MRLISHVLATWVLMISFTSFAAGSGVSAVDARWIKAMKAGDADAVAECYAKDAILWAAGAPVANGADQIRATYKHVFGSFIVHDAALTEISSETIGSKSVAWGTYQLTLAPKAGGATVNVTGRYTVVARQEHGVWVYAVDHASDDPSQPPN